MRREMPPAGQTGRVVRAARVTRSVRRAAALAGAALAAAGCGSASVHDLPPAAEPARSPPLARPPVGRVLPVGSAPEGLAADPSSGRLLVALRDPAGLALVDGRTSRVVKRIAIPGAARHLALERPGGAFLVPAERAGRLLRVRAQDGRLLSDVGVGAFPHDATAAADRRVFVGNERGDSVSVVDGGRVAATLGVAAQPGGLAAPAGGRLVAVVSVRERVLELFDARSLKRVGRVAAGVGPTHVIADAPGRLLYVVDTQGDALLVFTLRPKLQLVRRVSLPGSPYGIALDARRARLYVSLTARNELIELPAHGRPHPLRSFATVRQPDTVAVDQRTGRVFVTGRVAGVLQALDPRTARPNTRTAPR